jgi:hypothetical protein
LNPQAGIARIDRATLRTPKTGSVQGVLEMLGYFVPKAKDLSGEKGRFMGRTEDLKAG